MVKEDLEKLIDKYLAGTTTPAENSLIDKFFDAQEKKQTLQHYRLSEEMWASIQASVKEKTPFTDRKPVPAARRFRFKRSLVGFSITIASVLGLVYMYQADVFNLSSVASAPVWITSQTPKGQKAIITLTDGSRVYLNSASSISYPETFNGNKREIKLSGEAFFEVTRDESKPFLVHTDNVTTQVLGTSFNIMAIAGQPINVSVATGRVQVEAKENNIENSKTDKVVIMPNQQAMYNATNNALTTSAVDISKVIAWKNNTLYFEDMALKDVAVQIERWYNVSIEFKTDAIRNCKINGTFKELSLLDVLKSIQYMHGVDYKIENQNKVILYGKGCNN